MKNQTGSLSIVPLLVLVVLVVGGAGLYVATHNMKSTTKAAVASKNQTYTNSAGFTLQYPNNWKFVEAGTKVGAGQFASDEFLPTANYPDNNAYNLPFITDKAGGTAEQYAVHEFSSKTDVIVSSTNSKINGYDTHTFNYDVPGVSGSPHGYDVTVFYHGKVVDFNYTTSSPYDSIYQSIINSIKFTD